MGLLLAEDDDMIAEPVAEVIRRTSYAIDWARDGREAELSLDQNRYDLALLDLGLRRRTASMLSTVTASAAVSPP